LLDHDVKEENINLVSLLMAEQGVHTIAYAFPKVNIITTAVDPEINDKSVAFMAQLVSSKWTKNCIFLFRFHVLPGIGNFGDRYFGTEFKAFNQYTSH